jgi:hypothetical protein
MLFHEFNTVVFTDIPDPDNILMMLQALAKSKGPVAIVLSPRIVDLSAARYGPNFAEIRKKVSFDTMAFPIEQGQRPVVSEEWKKWFRHDGTLSSKKIRTDTRLYMDVSAMRVNEVLRKYAPHKEYEIFWDPDSLHQIKEPDMRHALHVADFRFNFNTEHTKQYKEITAKHPSGGRALRKGLRKICYRYIARQCKEMDLGLSEITPTDLRYLLKANAKVEGARILIGGPLTEALQYLKSTPEPGNITAMFGTLTNDRNTFGDVQFNLRKDLKSARGFLEMVAAKGYRLQVVPTECCKSKDAADPCPYVLKLSNYQSIMGKKSLVYRMICRWGEDASQTQHYGAFDWITAISATTPEILRWVPVMHEVCLDGEKIKNIKFKEADVNVLTSIYMARHDYKYMADQKKILIDEMQEIFRNTSESTQHSSVT